MTMTRDQKQVLKSLLLFAAFKAVLYLAINQAAKAAREAIAKHDPSGLTGQFTVKTGTDVLGGHVDLRGGKEIL